MTSHADLLRLVTCSSPREEERVLETTEENKHDVADRHENRASKPFSCLRNKIRTRSRGTREHNYTANNKVPYKINCKAVQVKKGKNNPPLVAYFSSAAMI